MSEQPPFRIDSDSCVGHGRCYALAPESFDSDDMGKGVVRERQEHESSWDPEAIVNACPEGAIELTTVGDKAGEGTQS